MADEVTRCRPKSAADERAEIARQQVRDFARGGPEVSMFIFAERSIRPVPCAEAVRMMLAGQASLDTGDKHTLVTPRWKRARGPKPWEENA
jgi:lauroyl/myristoyl acyltransferase